jgi:hypothetical protein
MGGGRDCGVLPDDIGLVSCLTILVLAARVGWMVSGDNSVTAAWPVANAQMDRRG